MTAPREKVWVEVNNANIKYNFAALERLLGKQVTPIAIIKANAYGHGLAGTAKTLASFQNIWFGVDSIDEALALDRLRLKKTIVILGYIPPPRLKEAIAHHFHFSVYNRELLEKVNRIMRHFVDYEPYIHLKIETGTNRLGIKLKELLDSPTTKLAGSIAGIYTHFAEVENPKSKFYLTQLAELKKAEALLLKHGIKPKYIHSASTAAILQFPNTYFNMARLGIGLYGLWPSEEIKKKLAGRLPLKPALTWKTRVAQIKEIKNGDTVGYDRTYRARWNRRIAILPIGYYDGYDRGLSNCGEVLVHGKRAKIAGNICMNMTMIDVTDIPARTNDEVVLLGDKISAEEIAKKINSINYEIAARINPLIKRVYL